MSIALNDLAEVGRVVACGAGSGDVACVVSAAQVCRRTDDIGSVARILGVLQLPREPGEEAVRIGLPSVLLALSPIIAALARTLS